MKENIRTVVLFLAFCGSLFSCCKAIFSLSTVFKNNTSHPLLLTSYLNGNMLKSVAIDKFSLIRYGEEESVIGGNIDSVIVIWEDTIKVVHYVPNKEGNDPNGIKHTNPRSLYNPTAFTNDVKELKCDGRHTEATYTFTEQDYLNAKKE